MENTLFGKYPAPFPHVTGVGYAMYPNNEEYSGSSGKTEQEQDA